MDDNGFNGFYLGVMPCGCTPRVIVDRPDLTKDIAVFFKECDKDGFTVRHVDSLDDVELSRCKCNQEIKQSEPLFDTGG